MKLIFISLALLSLNVFAEVKDLTYSEGSSVAGILLDHQVSQCTAQFQNEKDAVVETIRLEKLDDGQEILRIGASKIKYGDYAYAHVSLTIKTKYVPNGWGFDPIRECSVEVKSRSSQNNRQDEEE